MIKSSNIGYPRIGEKREWKKALERFWKGNTSEKELFSELQTLRINDLKKQKEAGLDLIPIGDYSLYDHVLDTAVMFGFIPERFRHQDSSSLKTYFDIARGSKEAVASEMTKWFNTNYHYIVPEISENDEPRLTENRLLHYFLEAKDKAGIIGKPVILGPVSFLKLSKGFEKEALPRLVNRLVPLYIQVLKELYEAGAEWVQMDEPVLTTQMSDEEFKLLESVYERINDETESLHILLQTYFEGVDRYEQIISLPVDGIGLDFIHDGGANLEAMKKYGFPNNKTLAAGIINGRNIWKTDLTAKLTKLEMITNLVDKNRLIIQPSCSLLHVPVTVKSEQNLKPSLKNALAFADEKLTEIKLLADGIHHGKEPIADKLDEQAEYLNSFWHSEARTNPFVRQEVQLWEETDPKRNAPYSERQKNQQEFFELPLLPTTTIGSLPQTNEVRLARRKWRKGEWADEKYEAFIKESMNEWIKRQEEIGLDVLIHGEFERNDMVEFFGEKLAGFAFTQYAWVQSYGSRCVKPPIIHGDISLTEPMTVKEIAYAQSLTDKPVKGMLTGPITILNWSFVRDDISRFAVTKQIALALQKEIRFLEEEGIHMIQVDEPALREGLPLKPDKQQEYLDQAVYAFKLATSAVQNKTQIHTHMCYSEFGEIMEAIDRLDADVISIEAARSHGELITDFEKTNYEKEIGLGVYDIHSPRVPEASEMESYIHRALAVLHPSQFWVNPDCGLKTRGTSETVESLRNMVRAARYVRENIKKAGDPVH